MVLWQWSYYWLLLYAILALETLLALAFFYKYTLWQPGMQRLTGSLYAAIGMLLVLVPGGILAAIPLAVWTTVRGVQRLDNWWNTE